MSLTSLSDEFTIGQTIETEVDRPPFLFVSKGAGVLYYRVVIRGGAPKLACFRDSHGIPAEVNHCPRYKTDANNKLVDEYGVPLNLGLLRDSPLYSRRSVKVCLITGNKLIVE
mgnify:CR=1 FL=1